MALALIDAACLTIVVDDHVDPTEIDYVEGLAAALLGTDETAGVVRDSLARVTVEGVGAVCSSVAGRLRRMSEREVAYLAASGAIYRDGHLAHREAHALSELAAALGLDRASVDRLSTDERLVLGAAYPSHWRLDPRSAPGSVNDELEAWATARGLLRDERARSALADMDLETFQRFTFPRCADSDALLWAAKYTLWLYLFDDVVEAFTSEGALAEARAFVAPCLVIPSGSGGEPGLHPLIGTFAELTHELFERAADPGFPAKWEDSHRSYWLRGILSEVEPALGASDATASLRHNLLTRPWASGVGIYFDIGEVICGAPIPLALRDRPAVEEIRYLGALIGGAFNDILSYDKEKPFDNLANTALALRRAFALDDRGALTYAIAFHNELVRACDERIERFASEGGDTFSAYAAMVREVLHGLAAWQLLSPRYLNRHSVEIRTDDRGNPGIDPDRLATLGELALERP